MTKTMLFSMFIFLMFIGLPAYSATTFIGTVDSDFNNAANWDTGLLPGKMAPLGTGGNAVINTSATLTADFVQGGGDDGFTLFIGNGTSGDLTIPQGLALYPTSGSDTGALDILIGIGAGGVGTFNIAGTYTAIGAGADMFIGDNAGGYGVVNIFDGGTMEIRKAVEIINGKLTIGATAGIGTGLQDELVVDNGGTLGFILAVDSTSPRYMGKSLILELGSTSTLELTLTGGYNIGDSWTLINGISTFTGVNGGDGMGEFGDIVSTEGYLFDINYTPESTAGAGNGTLKATLLSLGTEPAATNPTPDNETGQFNPAGTMSWDVVNAASPTFDIIIASDSYFNTILVDDNTGSSQSYSIPAGVLAYDSTYYWRVDVTDGGQSYPGLPWSFSTGGKPYDPVPADGGTTSYAGLLNWSCDPYIASYDVYFGTPGSVQFIDNIMNTSVALSTLATNLSRTILLPGDYQWRIDSWDSSGNLAVTGDTWNVTITSEADPFAVEYFDYLDTADMKTNWSDGSSNGTGSTSSLDYLFSAMKLSYDNTDVPYKSEAVLTFVSPQDWSDPSKAALEISMLGASENSNESVYLILFDGSQSVQVNCDFNDAATLNQWRIWQIALSDFADDGVSLSNITQLTIGVGDGGSAGSGILLIDDIELYPARYMEENLADGDLDQDYLVNMADLKILIDEWLMEDYEVVSSLGPAANLLAHYSFEETSGLTSADSSGNNQHAVIEPNLETGYWSADGYNSTGCLKVSNDLKLILPESVFANTSSEVTIAFRVKGQADDFPDNVHYSQFYAGQIPLAGQAYQQDYISLEMKDSGAYGNFWSHYAYVKDTISGWMKIYHNGVLVSQTTDNSVEIMGSQAGQTVLQLNGGDFVQIDDLLIYNKALTHGQIVNLVGSGSIIQPISPLLSIADVVSDGVVNLSDFAVIAQAWLTEQLWP